MYIPALGNAVTITIHFTYKGTLGQPNQWTLGVTCSYKHPMVPDDVSNDPAPKSDEEENIPVKKMEEDVTEKTTLFLDYEIGSSQPANEDVRWAQLILLALMY